MFALKNLCSEPHLSDSTVHNTKNILDYNNNLQGSVWSGSPYDYSHLEQLSVFSWLKRCKRSQIPRIDYSDLDVKTAFLHGDLEEDIYMDQPEGLDSHVCFKHEFEMELEFEIFMNLNEEFINIRGRWVHHGEPFEAEINENYDHVDEYIGINEDDSINENEEDEPDNRIHDMIREFAALLEEM
ncbi:hypothetical protein ACJX0J_022273, partial [Zea mays]